ncbi:MAG TPA: DUF2652 domain-containing protein [Flavobacteriaceae bacterium]|jgi:hypothetical protein|nr:hypothetical protein [Flavobacteriaceae bacterium]HBR54847.1 DUF2652 domain-containing protein [Flavobacteriaceae bacterium]|tara:strand:+ start:44554 stop:45159 length:606 start_codon:yes stop_codon:yes gene_type:complete
MKPSPALICIPDISGFTEFMRNVDIEVSSQVIPALLNEIIYSNEINLKVSEIEGDAVLFYRKGELPPFDALVKQCKAFYTQFYEQMEELLEKFRDKRKNVSFPEILGLKIILHYGDEIGMVPIGNHIKLMGEDVITAHRLLKNKVPIDEYLLISDTLLARYKEDSVAENFDWAQLKSAQQQVEHLGTLKYHYINLKPLNGD